MTPFALYFAPLDSPGGPLVWLFGGGIGTNIGASLIWGFMAGFVGYLIAKRLKAAWARLHEKVDGLHARHEQNHAVLLERVRRVGESVADLHEKLDPGPPHRVVDRPRD